MKPDNKTLHVVFSRASTARRTTDLYHNRPLVLSALWRQPIGPRTATMESVLRTPIAGRSGGHRTPFSWNNQ